MSKRKAVLVDKESFGERMSGSVRLPVTLQRDLAADEHRQYLNAFFKMLIKSSSWVTITKLLFAAYSSCSKSDKPRFPESLAELT